MTILDLLMTRDPSVRRVTSKYLLNQEAPFVTDGWISQFIGLFDMEKGTWGNGIYSPKWISTFYTLRDLKSLEIDPDHPVYQRGLKTLAEHMWNPARHMSEDVCVVAMMASMFIYGRYNSEAIEGMISYIADKQMADGGWNCEITRKPASKRPHKSSIHTTMSVLEAYWDYECAGFMKSLVIVRRQGEEGREYLLKKGLMRRESDGKLIFGGITDFHFPDRWKYDVLRGLVYFASIGHPYDPRMEEALALLAARMSKGYLGRGSAHGGKLHFMMETGKLGSMNTLRGLWVLKHYDRMTYENIIQREIQFFC